MFEQEPQAMGDDLATTSSPPPSRGEAMVPAGGLLTDYRLQQRDYLLKIARAMTSRLDLRDVLDLVIRSAVTMTNGQAGAIALRRPDGSLEMVASYRLDENLTIRLEGWLGERRSDRVDVDAGNGDAGERPPDGGQSATEDDGPHAGDRVESTGGKAAGPLALDDAAAPTDPDDDGSATEDDGPHAGDRVESTGGKAAGPFALDDAAAPTDPDDAEPQRGRRFGPSPAWSPRPHTSLATRQAEAVGRDDPRLLTLPLAMSGDTIGQILILRSEGASVFTPLDGALLSAFADQAAVAIQNAFLHERLGARERQLAAIVEHSAGGVLLADSDGTVIAHNPAAAALAGCPPRGLVGAQLTDVLRLVDDRGAATELELPGAPGDELVVRGHLVVGGPQGRFVQIALRSLAGAGGRGAGWVADLTDLTAYKRAEDAKTAFLAGLSHDLKTPLALIRGYAETLTMDRVRDDDALFAEAVQVILDETAVLTAAVERMLRAARMESEGVALDLDEVDVGGLVSRTVEEFRIAAPGRTWHVHVAPDLPAIVADRVRLREALANLLDNAVRYSEPGTRVEVSADRSGAGVRIAVRDQGIGIAREHQDRVFERFARLSQREDGTGLGLFMARAIVAAHGGSITLESRPGAGSTFVIVLPALPPATAEGPA